MNVQVTNDSLHQINQQQQQQQQRFLSLENPSLTLINLTSTSSADATTTTTTTSTTTTVRDLLEYAVMDSFQQSTDCHSSNLFPVLLMSYTAAGIVFGVANCVLLIKIYRTSSLGSPTLDRHPRTEIIEQLLEWFFLPVNVLHFIVWLCGVSAMVLAWTYSPYCDNPSMADQYRSPSTAFTVIWILCAVVNLLSQGTEIFWNASYVLLLYYKDPFALQQWTPLPSSNYPDTSQTSDRLHSYHHSSTGSLHSVLELAVDREDSDQSHRNHELVEQMWADRCQNLCRCLGMGTCYILGGRDLHTNGAIHYGDFARAMADYLETQGVLDVVPSDIIVGFMVLQQVQTQRRYSQRREVIVEQSKMSLVTSDRSGRSSNTSLGQIMDPHRGTSIPMLQEASPQQQHCSSASDNTLTGMQPHGMASKKQDRRLKMLSMGAGRVTEQQERSLAGIKSSNSLQQPPNNAKMDQLRENAVLFDQSTPPPKKPRSSILLSSTETKDNVSMDSFNLSSRGFQRVFSERNHADMSILEDGARYSKYALAIYTWYLYLFEHPVTGIPKLCAKALTTKSWCCCCSGSAMHGSLSTGNLQHSASNTSPGNGGNNASPRLSHSRQQGSRWEGDNICQVHKSALLLQAGLDDESDLVYMQLKSSFNENPYCILVDHETQAVVVAIRGTFSLEDCITDVLLEPQPLDSFGEEFGFGDIAKGQYCHGGVIATARNVYRDLQRHASLDYLLGTKYPHYRLRLAGHSLGAACSTLLGLMLKHIYPDLLCFNYSPPGGTLTWDLAIHCQSWCTSFVMDTEMVPRLSFEAMENLRDESLELIGRIRVSKIEVARRVASKNLWQLSCTGNESSSEARPHHGYDVERAEASIDDLNEMLNELLLPLDEMPSDDSPMSYRQQLAQFQAVQSERRRSRGHSRAIRLFPPGKMLHLVKTAQKKSLMVNIAKFITCWTTNAGSQYTPVWIGNGDLNEIVISPTMGTDHFPNRMVDELEGILESYGRRPFR